MRKIYHLFFLYILLTGCHKNKKDVNINFTRSDFKQTINLDGEVINFDKPLHPLEFNVIRDSIILSTNWDGTPYFLEIYNLHSKKLITQIAEKGSGPNEYLSCSIIQRDPHENFFVIYDIVKQTFARFDMDSVLLKGINYKPKQQKVPRYTKDVTFWDEKNILGYNDYYFKSEKINNQALPMFKMNIDEPMKDLLDTNVNKYFVANVSGGYILPSPDKKRIILVNHYTDKIDFYNEHLELIKSLKGPDHIKPEYYVGNDNSISFKGKYYRSYYACVYTENAVYLTYLGVNGVPNEQSFEKPVEVFKISWDGELLANFKLKDYVYNISIDEHEKYIYGTGVKYIGEYPKLMRYKIN